MAQETAHEALLSVGLLSRPHPLNGKREIYRKDTGETVGVWSAKEAFENVAAIRSAA